MNNQHDITVQKTRYFPDCAYWIKLECSLLHTSWQDVWTEYQMQSSLQGQFWFCVLKRIFFTFLHKLAFLQKSTSCPSLVVSCPKFYVAHPRANCRGRKGDFLSLGKQRFERFFSPSTRLPPNRLMSCISRFCQNKGPMNFSSSANKLTLTFKSNGKANGEGAECIVACSDLTKTSETNTYTGKLGPRLWENPRDSF